MLAKLASIEYDKRVKKKFLSLIFFFFFSFLFFSSPHTAQATESLRFDSPSGRPPGTATIMIISGISTEPHKYRVRYIADTERGNDSQRLLSFEINNAVACSSTPETNTLITWTGITTCENNGTFTLTAHFNRPEKPQNQGPNLKFQLENVDVAIPEPKTSGTLVLATPTFPPAGTTRLVFDPPSIRIPKPPVAPTPLLAYDETATLTIAHIPRIPAHYEIYGSRLDSQVTAPTGILFDIKPDGTCNISQINSDALTAWKVHPACEPESAAADAPYTFSGDFFIKFVFSNSGTIDRNFSSGSALYQLKRNGDVVTNSTFFITTNQDNIGFGFDPSTAPADTPITMTIDGIPIEPASYKVQIINTGLEILWWVNRKTDTPVQFSIDSAGCHIKPFDTGARSAWSSIPTCSGSGPFTVSGTFPMPTANDNDTHTLRYQLVKTDNDEAIAIAALTLGAAATTPEPPPPPCLEGVGEHGELVQNDPYAPLDQMQKIVKCTKVYTQIGGIDTDPAVFIKRIFGLLLGLAGGIALLLIIYSGYRLMTSQGDPEKIQGARETLTSAIVGLLFMIFSLVILQVIGVDILKIPNIGVTKIVEPTPTPVSLPTPVLGLPAECIPKLFSVQHPDICSDQRAQTICYEIDAITERAFTPTEQEIYDLCSQKGFLPTPTP